MIRVLTLGAVSVSRDDRTLETLPLQPRRFALLVYLAVEREVTRQTLLNLFWSDQEPERGRHALRQMLYELRKVLGDDWLDVRKDTLSITGSPECEGRPATGPHHNPATL